MGNAISSIKGVFSRYWEFSEKCTEYRFECPSFPVVEGIVNNVILFPFQVLVLSPYIVCGAVKTYPITLASHCFTVFKLGVPVYSLEYAYSMAIVGSVTYILYEGGKGIYETMSDPEKRNEFWISFKKRYERDMRFYDLHYRNDPARNHALRVPLYY